MQLAWEPLLWPIVSSYRTEYNVCSLPGGSLPSTLTLGAQRLGSCMTENFYSWVAISTCWGPNPIEARHLLPQSHDVITFQEFRALCACGPSISSRNPPPAPQWNVPKDLCCRSRCRHVWYRSCPSYVQCLND
jgi:hypothetical protein